MVTLFDEWLKRLPNVRLQQGRAAQYRTGMVFAVTELPIEWDVASVPH
jgi:hypothetical protein